MTTKPEAPKKDPRAAKIVRLEDDLKAAQEYIAKLEFKLSPNQSHTFTARVRRLLAEKVRELAPYKASVRGEEGYCITSGDLFRVLFGHAPTVNEMTMMLRSVRALLWEDTRTTGVTSLRITQEEFDEITKNRA